MQLKGKEMHKFNYIKDIFDGTCELNNCENIMIPVSDEQGQLIDDSIEKAATFIGDQRGRFYFHTPYYTDKEKYQFVVIAKAEKNVYLESELVNLAVKVLHNLDEYEVIVNLGGSENHDDLQEVLDSIEIASALDSVALDERYEKELGFDIVIGEDIVAHGGANYGVGIAYFTMDYETLEKHVSYVKEKQELDAFIVPKNQKCMNDAFIVGTNLKDAGFKIEIHYLEHKVEEENIRANFLITFDEKDIANYEVELKDLKTKESHKVKIDDLIEELSFL